VRTVVLEELDVLANWLATVDHLGLDVGQILCEARELILGTASSRVCASTSTATSPGLGSTC
jgi:hypothetical protein